MSSVNFLEKLLDGVAVNFLPLGDVTNYEQPTKYLVAAKNYSDYFDTPVLTAGKTFILGYTDESEGIYRASEHPVIIFDDFTTANKWVDFDFKAKSSAMKMITSKDNEKFLLKYIYYWLNTLPNELIDGDHKRQWIGNYSNKLIPIPCAENPKKSLEIQAEIVRILDAMTTHTAELTAELTARKKQYNYYRDKLLSFEDGEVEWKELGEICRFINGRAYKQPELLDSGKYPVLRVGNFFTNGNWYYSDLELDPDKYCDKGDLLYAWSASFGPRIWEGGKVIYHYHIWKILPDLNLVSKKYLYYLLAWDTEALKAESGTGSTMMHIGKGSIEKRLVPVPSLKKQAQIVSFLDKFDALTASITEGLPREIELREKQYAYYRDLLLSFPQAQAA